jgi:hypothetical protein
MLKNLLTTVLFLSFAFFAMGQTPDSLAKPQADTVIKKADPVKPTSLTPKIKKEKTYHPDSTHIPSLAVRRSLFVPGWGQVYNHKIWKVPLIYAGLGLLGNAIVVNLKQYKVFLALAKITRTGADAGGPPESGDKDIYKLYQKYKPEYDRYVGQYHVSNQDLENAASGYQRNFQISILSVLAVWGVQAIDAYIDAKFISSYTVDNNLSMKVTPTLMAQPMYASNFNSAFIPGIKFTFTL